MALLDRANTEFAASVLRTGMHFQSGRLEKIQTALTDAQNNPASTDKLVYLMKRLHRWIEENPKEMLNRGGTVDRLAYEIEVKAAQIGANITVPLGEYRRVTQAWATQWTPLTDIRANINAHNGEWDLIDITDKPTGQPGVYNFTPGNVFAEGDRNVASQETTGSNKQNDPKYWLRLGRKVLTPQTDGKCYGRCFSCAAAVIHSLVMDTHFDDYVIEHVGAAEYDHHLILVGRSNANGTSDAGIADGNKSWLTTAVVIDVWQANLNDNHDYASLAYQNAYARGTLRWFCAYPVNRRDADRVFAQTVAIPVRSVPVRLDIAAQARLAVQSQGAATRNVKVDGKWTIVQETAPGSDVWVPV